MAKHGRKLTQLEINKIKQPGKYSVGGCLYLQISKSLTRSWAFRYKTNGKTHWMGLGSCEKVTLKQARRKVLIQQNLQLDGHDPLTRRKKETQDKRRKRAQQLTFDQCAQRYIETRKAGWTNKKHFHQWESTLKTYASPVLGKIPVCEIDTPMVLKVIEPIWETKTETASRVRGRIEAILDWATVHQQRSGPNPAIWRGNIDKVLQPKSKVNPVKHFKALSYKDVASFLVEARRREGLGPKALEFMILTVSRVGNTVGAKWDEICIEERYWNIPAHKMKAKNNGDHRVPLGNGAIEILLEMQKIRQNDYVFPGKKRGQHLSDASVRKVHKSLGYEITSHGFRSTFTDWASETTGFTRETIEMALSHTIGNKVEAAYRRGNLFSKRKKLMLAWDTYCNTTEVCQADVIEAFSKSYSKTGD